MFQTSDDSWFSRLTEFAMAFFKRKSIDFAVLSKLLFKVSMFRRAYRSFQA
jgi:hypothetical protein